MRHWYLFAAMAVFGAQTLVAAPAASPVIQTQKVDPAALAAADRVLTAMGYDRMMRRTCDAMLLQMGPLFKNAIEDKTGEKVDDALVEKLVKIESDFLHAVLVDSPDVRRATALIYARAFTATELDHMVDLYRDPVMRKWTEVSPEMAAEMLPLVHGVVESHRTELEEKIAAAVTDYYAAKKTTTDS